MRALTCYQWGLWRPYKALHALAYARFQDVAQTAVNPSLTRRQRLRLSLQHLRWDWLDVRLPLDADDWHMFDGLRWEPSVSLWEVSRFHPSAWPNRLSGEE